jgi:hypothetical protein
MMRDENMGEMGELPEAHKRSRGVENLVHAARDTAPVSGLTHNFYRYPARFSPSFVRAAIHAFSDPGDWVMDPFAGGGTTLVEALSAGRNALGVDISSLATFVCEAKTHILSDQDSESLRQWARRLPKTINIHGPSYPSDEYSSAGYYRNICGPEHWRIRKVIEQALASVERLKSENATMLARCVVLRTAQWALDGRKTLPSIPKFRDELARQAEAMRSAALKFRVHVEQHKKDQKLSAICLNRTAAGLENEAAVMR